MHTPSDFLSRRFLNLLLPLAFVVFSSGVVFGQTTKVDVILKAIDTKSRTIEVEHNGKTSQLDLSSKVKVTIKGEAAEASALIAGDEATVEYHKELAVVTSIDAKGNELGAASQSAIDNDLSVAGVPNLIGTWFAVAEDFNGVETQESEVRARKKTLTIIGDRFILHSLGKDSNSKPTTIKGQMVVNTNTQPVEFDWAGVFADGSKVELTGIMEVNSDSLRIVYSFKKKAADSPRPKRFSSKGEGGGNVVILFQREPLE